MFDRKFLSLGNVLIVFGIGFLIGIRGIFGTFSKPEGRGPGILLAAGFFLVLFKRPVIGIILEILGTVWLVSSSALRVGSIVPKTIYTISKRIAFIKIFSDGPILPK